MTLILAGDIGGTKTILRLEQHTSEGWQTLGESIYPSRDFAHLTPMIQKFLTEGGYGVPQVACLAIAGPVVNDRSQVTNLHWSLDARQMEIDLKIPTIRLINDFAAVGYGTLALQPEDIIVLQDQPIIPKAPIAVLGAGTGLGEALLFWNGMDYDVTPTEGGHTDFAPRSDLEIGLLKYLRDRHRRVSVERVVSGQGIYAIYEYLRDAKIAPESPAIAAEINDPATDNSKVIAQYALEGQDELCQKVLDVFVAAYGAEAGNLALKSLPRGGLYLAGGVAAKILPKMQDGQFLENFLDKGRMKPLLETLCICLILNEKVGLGGAANYAHRLSGVIKQA
jgi:glucokinase